jgi:hypothetical protein
MRMQFQSGMAASITLHCCERSRAPARPARPRDTASAQHLRLQCVLAANASCWACFTAASRSEAEILRSMHLRGKWHGTRTQEAILPD